MDNYKELYSEKCPSAYGEELCAFQTEYLGAGHGFAQPPLTSVIVTAVPPSMFGTASGVSRLASQIGSSLGLSLFGALLSVPAEDLGLPMIFVIGMVISFLGLIPAYFIQSSKKRHS
ncbi:MAG: hypothetical protein CMI60_14390 [Parvibaculum sp.]|nr:hypothetical protein [Parvibaculum sp.]